MSGIAGIIHFDGKPVEPGLIQKMTSAMAHRGPDGINHWVQGSVALGQCMLRTTPESLEEHQPLTNEDASLVLVMDGRVDNCEELRRELLGRGVVLRSRADAELVLKAYEVWGDDSPSRILGDFAYVVWDASRRRLFCGRDVLGIKPFYFYWDGSLFLYGSELSPLFKHPAIRREPNEGMIAEYLSGNIHDREETLYRGITRLPAAHYLKVRRDQLEKRKYWDIDPTREVHYNTDSQYAEHFSNLFAEVVACRLRGYPAIGAELSGGVDSSSIAALAQKLCVKAGQPGLRLETFALAFPGLSCDETDFAESVVSMWGLTHHILVSQPSDPSWFIREIRRSGDFPPYPTWAAWDRLWSLTQKKGLRVLLNGAGGDEWLTGSVSHYADLLRQFKLHSLFRQLNADRQFAASRSMPAVTFPALALVRAGVWPLVPASMRRMVKKAVKPNSGDYGLVTPKFARRTNLRDRFDTRNSRIRFPTHAQQSIYGQLAEGGGMPHGIEMRDRLNALHSLESRFPFMDRRIIEFALALPEDQRWRGRYTKLVLRNAMKGLLPEKILWRRTKADFSHVFVEALKALQGDRHFKSLAIASMGWIDGTKAPRMYADMVQSHRRGDLGWANLIWPLWMILGIELWYRAVMLDEPAAP